MLKKGVPRNSSRINAYSDWIGVDFGSLWVYLGTTLGKSRLDMGNCGLEIGRSGLDKADMKLILADLNEISCLKAV